MTVKYQRLVEAELHVHLANGESWPATDDDLGEFDLVNGSAAMQRFDAHLSRALQAADLVGDDINKARLSSLLRWFVESTMRYPEHLNTPAMARTDEQLVTLERALQNSRRIITSVDELEELPVASGVVSATDFIWQKNTTLVWRCASAGEAAMDSAELLQLSRNKLFLIHRPLTEAT